MHRKFFPPGRLAFIGSALGLLAGLLIGLQRFGVVLFFQETPAGSNTPAGDALVGQLAYLLVFLLPFALSLLVLRMEGYSLPSVVWLGTGLLSILGAVIFYPQNTFYLLLVPGVLVLGAGGASFLRPAVGRSLLVILLVLVLVAVGGASFGSLFSQETPVCWSLVRSNSGAEHWERMPQETLPVGPPDDSGDGQVLSWSCKTDVISQAEGIRSLGVWAVGLAGLFAVRKLEVLD